MTRGPKKPKDRLKLPDLGLGEGRDYEIVGDDAEDQGRRGIHEEPLTDDQLGLTAKPVEEVRLPANPPQEPPKGRNVNFKNAASRYQFQVIHTLVRNLTCHDPRVQVAAATQLALRIWGTPKPEGAGDDAEDSDVRLAIKHRLEEMAQLPYNIEHLEQTLAIMKASRIAVDPNAPAEVAPAVEQAALPPPEIESEPKPAVEVEVIHEQCFCGGYVDQHESGGQCSHCEQCNLYVSLTEAAKQRAGSASTEGVN